MKKCYWLSLVASLALLGASCGAKNADKGTAARRRWTSTTHDHRPGRHRRASTAKFGDAESPCGKGKYTVKADQAGKGDRQALHRRRQRPWLDDPTRPAQGDLRRRRGLQRLVQRPGRHRRPPDRVVDLDGKLLQVEAAMATACTDVFMMVGGGYAQDNLEFSGKDGSDFHKCKLVDIPGFAVSVDQVRVQRPGVSPSRTPPSPSAPPGSRTSTSCTRRPARRASSSTATFRRSGSTRSSTSRPPSPSVPTLSAEEPYPATGLSDWTPARPEDHRLRRRLHVLRR